MEGTRGGVGVGVGGRAKSNATLSPLQELKGYVGKGVCVGGLGWGGGVRTEALSQECRQITTSEEKSEPKRILTSLRLLASRTLYPLDQSGPQGYYLMYRHTYTHCNTAS